MIETLFALAILSLIGIFFLPSFSTLLTSSNEIKDDSRVIFALEEAIENEKAAGNYYGYQNISINGIDILIHRESYNENLDLIRASHGKFHMELVEESYEKKRLYTD